MKSLLWVLLGDLRQCLCLREAPHAIFEMKAAREEYQELVVQRKKAGVSLQTYFLLKANKYFAEPNEITCPSHTERWLLWDSTWVAIAKMMAVARKSNSATEKGR